MSLNTWSRSGSEKAQASQSIRILLKTLQYLAEDAGTDDNREKSFIKIATTIIKNTFTPSTEFSVNEQVSVFFNALGWKNTQIKLTSANEAEFLLGSNRHLDQDPDSVQGLHVLIKTFGTALGAHIFDRDVNATVDIDIHTGPTYLIRLRAVQKRDETEKATSKAKPTTTPSQSTLNAGETKKATSSISSAPPVKGISTIETDQIFLPVLNNKMDVDRLHLILQDILAEFSNSWYGANPLNEQRSEDPKENVIALITFLTQKAVESDASIVDIGAQIGNYFALALQESYQDSDLVSEEILEGSAVGSIIRDIKARAFCYLKADEKCGPEIGGENREICDFSMGLWQGCLSKLVDGKEFIFTGFYAAGRRDPLCLMEFDVK